MTDQEEREIKEGIALVRNFARLALFLAVSNTLLFWACALYLAFH